MYVCKCVVYYCPSGWLIYIWLQFLWAVSDDDNDTDTAINEDSSSFTVQRTWLKARLENYCNDKGIMKGDEGKLSYRWTSHRHCGIHKEWKLT